MLGSGAKPIPVGTWANIGDGWRMKVTRVLRNVTQQQLGLGHEPLPKGAENVVVAVTVEWVRGGSGNSQWVVNQMNVVAKHHAIYGADMS